MNSNIFNATETRAYTKVSETAVQNTSSTMTQRIAFVLVWAAVAIPMFWGVMKAWEEAQLMF